MNIITCKLEDAGGIVGSIIAHPAVTKVNFTGSAFMGRKIAEQCGQNLKPCLIKLGGKNSAIILEDVDVEKVVDQCDFGSICTCTFIPSFLTPSFHHCVEI